MLQKSLLKHTYISPEYKRLSQPGYRGFPYASGGVIPYVKNGCRPDFAFWTICYYQPKAEKVSWGYNSGERKKKN